MSVAAVLFLCFAGSCQRGQVTQANRVADKVPIQRTPTPTPEPDVSVRDVFGKLPIMQKEKIAGLRRAWSRIPQNHQFRMARDDDFGKPTVVYEYGEIAGASGLALVIVNRTRSSDDRFSLVVFIERPGNRYDTYWIYRDMNLKSYRMMRASGDIFVEEVLPDGSRKMCEIQWTKQKQKWNCEPL